MSSWDAAPRSLRPAHRRRRPLDISPLVGTSVLSGPRCRTPIGVKPPMCRICEFLAARMRLARSEGLAGRRRRECAYLLEHAHGVGDRPVLGDLPVGYQVDCDALRLDVLAR